MSKEPTSFGHFPYNSNMDSNMESTEMSQEWSPEPLLHCVEDNGEIYRLINIEVDRCSSKRNREPSGKPNEESVLI